MASEGRVTVRFEGDVSGLESSVNRVRGSMDGLSAAAKSAGASSAQGQASAAASIQNTNNKIQSIIQSSLRMGQTGKLAGDNLARGADNATRSYSRFFEAAREIRAVLAVLAGFKLSIAGGEKIRELVDGYTNLSSKIRNVTSSEDELNRVREKTFEIAQRTRSSFDATVTLYTRMTRATETLKLSEQERLGITETITKAYSLSGATVQEATNSIIQLTQGLASGTLRGEEFNSVAEQSPIILELLSKSLGKSRGELRKFASQGGLTAEVVTKAIMQGQNDIDRQFAKVSVTMEGAFQRVVNGWQKWLGEMNEASGASREVVGLLTYLSQHMDVVGESAIRLGQALILVFGSRITGDLTAYIAKQVEAGRAALANVGILQKEAVETNKLAIENQKQAATLAETNALKLRSIEIGIAKTVEEQNEWIAIQRTNIAEYERQVALVKSNTATVESMTLARDRAIAESELFGAIALGSENIIEQTLALNKQQIALTEAGVAAAKLAVAQEALTVATASSTIVQEAAIVANANIENLNGNLIVSEGVLNAAKAETVAINAALAASNTTVAGTTDMLALAQTRLGAGLAIAGNGLKFAFNALGGWIAVIAVAVYAIYSWLKASDDVKESLAAQEQATQALIDRTEALRRARELGTSEIGKQSNAQADLTKKAVDSITTEQAQVQATIDHNTSWQTLTATLGTSAFVAAAYSIKMNSLSNDLVDVTEKQKEFNVALKAFRMEQTAQKFIELKNNLNNYAVSLFGIGTMTELTGKAVDEYMKKTLSETQQLTANRIEREQGIRASKLYILEQKLGVNAYQRLSEERKKEFDQNIAAIESEKAATAGRKSATAALKEQSVAEKEHDKLMQNAQRTAEQGDELIKRIADGYRGPLAKANADYREQTKKLNEDLDAQLTLFRDGQLTPVQYTANIAANGVAAQQSAEQHADLIARLTEEQDVLGLLAKNNAYEISLISMTGRQRAFAEASKKATDEAKQNGPKFKAAGVDIKDYARAAGEAAVKLYDVGKAIPDLASTLAEFTKKSDFEIITEQIYAMEKALVKAKEKLKDAFSDPAVKKDIAELELGLANAKALSVDMAFNIGNNLLRAMQSMTKEGSKGFRMIGQAMAVLSIAQNLLAVKAAVNAILTQGQGEPYSAWARMAMMAAAVTPLLASIGAGISAFGGGGGGPSPNSAEARQKVQGTGTVLGDAAAKSESIQNAVEITADATKQLVGINRGMLNALQSLQKALGAAGNQIARGGANVKFPGLTSGSIGFDRAINPGPIAELVWGGSQRVIDQGVKILGGSITEMLKGIGAQAYQTVHTSGGWFSDGEDSEHLASASDAFNKQFTLVIKSIADTVNQGAIALGLLPADVEKAINAYQIAATNISLEGLSAEDQQKELEAVFSSIFDGLAASVVPFIGQFQKVGEGLGETLVRVATEVQVSQEAFRQLGLAVNETDPEKFAQIADGLVEAAGGIDAFVSSFQSFVSKFSTEAYQFKTNTDALNTAFEEAGLTLPTTREGMFALMQTLDATTESGRKQIAALLRLTDASDAYYTSLEKQTKAVNDATTLLQGMGILADGLTEFGKSIVKIKDQEKDAIAAADLIAKAQGRESASTVQIAQIHQWAAAQIAAAMKKLIIQTRDLIAQLYGGKGGSLETINAKITKIEAALKETTDGIGGVEQASNDLFESWKSGIKSLQDYLDQSQFGDLSTLSPEQQVTEAKRQLDQALSAAGNGDAEALAKLPQMMDQFARLFRDNISASGGDYNGTIDGYRDQLRALLGMQGPPNLGDGGGGTTTVVASPELQALYKERDAALAAQELEHRRVLALQLAQNLADLATLTRTPILEMIKLQNVSLTKLATDMGVDLKNLTGESVLALGNMATTLGISLTGLTGALGIKLTDLAGGLKEITKNLGINLDHLTVSSTQTLANLATSLGGKLTDLATSLGLDLGDLTSKQSLLNEALTASIGNLAPDTKAQLEPLLKAITAATNESDANTAIQNLEAAVNTIGGATATALAPYLPDVVAPGAWDQLDYLLSLKTIGENQLVALKDIARGLKVPGYAVGTPYVNGDQLAQIHNGEMVIDSRSADALRRYGINVGSTAPTNAANDNATVVNEIKALRNEVTALRLSNESGQRVIASTVQNEGQKDRNHNEDIARKNASMKRNNNYG